ncbi:MAG: MFS transporter [Chloroflexi bacterium]|nr:MFS transporter [Chloroflexota bacterium]
MAVQSDARAQETRFFGLTRNVFVLGLVSFLTDVSSEMTLTLLPLFLANVLGVRTSIIGLIEGVAEATASLMKVGSGWWSDRVGRRKWLTFAGYALSAVAKPFLAVAGNWGTVLAVRWTDRVGKGIRTSPRDALLADSAPVETRGRAFGWHRAADTAGAVVGLALSAWVIAATQRATLELTQATYRTIVLIGIIPGFLAVLLLAVFVQDVRPSGPRSKGGPLLRARGFSLPFYMFLGVIALFTLGNSSDAFLLLRAQNLGLSAFHIALMLVGFNVLYSLIAMPAGVLSDHLGRRRVILIGWGLYALVYLGFAVAGTAWQVVALYVLYGLYYGTTEGVARAFVADLVHGGQRATAYGLYHAVVGLMAFPASLLAGILWQTWGPATPFYFGALLAALAAVGLMALVRPGSTPAA